MLKVLSHTLLLTFALLPGVLRAQPALPRSPHPQYAKMVEAAKTCQQAERAIYLHKRQLGLFRIALDPNRTGLVGADTSIITTTPGGLTAKRTATNPDFAAYLVRELSSRGLSENDSVLVAMTGSLPGFNLSVIIALETLGIPSLRIVSMGSSSYGANLEEMTWLDIEDILLREGLIQTRSRYVTLGGSGDLADGMSAEGIDLLRKRCHRLGYPLLESVDWGVQRQLRLEQIGPLDRFALIINVGGNHLMLGDKDTGPDMPGGWIDPESFPWEDYINSDPKGIIFDAFALGVPLLNLKHVESLCEDNGIPYDPRPLPPVGTSPVYFIEAME